MEKIFPNTAKDFEAPLVRGVVMFADSAILYSDANL